MIQSYAYPNYYLDSNSGIIKFYNKNDGNKNKSNNDYLFIFVKSKDEVLNRKEAITIIPVNNIIDLDISKRRVLTRNVNDFIYRTVSNNSNNLIKNSSFYPVKTTCNELGNTVSFTTIKEFNPPYLGYDNKILKTYIKNDTNKMKESSCFNIIPFFNLKNTIDKTDMSFIKLFIYIKHQYSNKFLQNINDNICIFKNNTLDDNNKFQIIMDKYDLNNSFNLKINNKFLKYNRSNNKLLLTTNNCDECSSFKLIYSNDRYNLKLLNTNSNTYDTTMNNISNIPVFINNKDKKNTYKNNTLTCFIKYELV